MLLGELLQLSCSLLLMEECGIYSQELQGQLWEIQAKLRHNIRLLILQLHQAGADDYTMLPILWPMDPPCLQAPLGLNHVHLQASHHLRVPQATQPAACQPS